MERTTAMNGGGSERATSFGRSAAVRVVASLLAGVGAVALPAQNIDVVAAPTSEGSMAAIASIDDCGVLAVLPCAPQVARVAQPIAGSDLSLVYASDRVPGHSAGEGRDVRDQGLGGWTLSAVHTYSTDAGELLQGDARRRRVDAIAVDEDRLVVASDDGMEVYEFDRTGRHMRTYDAITGFVLLDVQWGDGGVETVSGPSGRIVAIGRRDDGSVVTITAQNGGVTSLAFDESGWLAHVAGSSGSQSSISTRPDGLVESVVGPGSGASFVYDDDGLLVEAASDGRSPSTFQRSVDDERVSVTTTVAGATWIDAFEPVGEAGWRRTHTDAAGGTSVEEFHGDGRRTLTLADGTVIATTYTADPRWGGHAPVSSMVTVDGPTLHSVFTEHRTAETFDADPRQWGNSSRTWAGPQSVRQLVYAAADRTATLARGADVIAAWTYDDAGRVIAHRAAGSAPAHLEYGDDGSVVSYRVGSGSDARTWTYESDPARATTTVTTPDGSVNTIHYDVAGRPEAVSRGTDTSIRVGYDMAGRPNVLSGPGDTTLTAAFSPAGAPLLTSTPGTGGPRSASTALDANGLPISIDWSDGVTVNFERDAIGRIIGVDEGALSYEISYDQIGRPVSVVGDGVEVALGWQGSMLSEQRWIGAVTGAVHRTFDRGGLVATEEVAGSPAVSVTHDASGEVTAIGPMAIDVDAAGRVTTAEVAAVAVHRTYNEFGELTSVDASVSGAPLFGERVERDAAGRVIERTDTTVDGESTTHYEYDANGWLVAVTVDGAAVTFDYDADGNLVSTTDHEGVTINAEYDAGDALVRVEDTDVEVDGAGRLASMTSAGAVTDFDYDRSGALQSVTLPDGRELEYVVDGYGRRVGRVVDGSLVQGFLYSTGPAPVAEVDAGGAVVSRISYLPDGTTPAYLMRDDRIYAYVVDHLGSPRLLVDVETGDVAQRIDYDAWGRIIADTNPGFQPLGFTGGLADPDTGLVRLGFRDYDPTRGRFTAPDPLGAAGGSTNLFVYAGNNPATHRDPYGLCWLYCPGQTVATVTIGGGGSYIVGGSGGVVIALAPDGLSVTPFVGVSGGVQAGLGGSATVGLQRRLDGQPATIGDFGADSRGESADLSVGPFIGGYEGSIGPNGGRTYAGAHVGAGTKAFGGSYGRQWMPRWFRSWCIGSGCPAAPKPPPGTCGNLLPPFNCTPPDPAPPAPPPPTQTDDPCAGPNPPTPCNPAPMCPSGFRAGQAECPDDQDAEAYDPGGAGSRGEPHLVTVNGDTYDFQAAGEFVLLESDDGGVVIQVRQEPLPGQDLVAFNTAVAFGVAGHRIGVYAGSVDGDLWIDGVPTALSRALLLGDRALVRPVASGYEVRWPDGTRALVWVSMASIDVSVAVSDNMRGSVHGLLGQPAGPGLLETRDGTAYPIDEAIRPDVLYGEFARSWLLSPEESLFDYEPGRTTESYHLADFPRDTTPPRAEQLADGEAMCRTAGVPDDLLDACAFDVAVTGDATYAVNHAAAAEAATSPPPPVDLLVGSPGPILPAPDSEPPAATPDTEPADVEAGGVLADGDRAAGQIDELGGAVRFELQLDGADVVWIVGWAGATDGCEQAFSVDLVEVSVNNYPCTGGAVGFDELDPTASYELEIRSVSGVGSFAFDLVTEKPRDFELTLGQSVTPGDPGGAGHLDVPGRIDRFRLDADGAEAITVTTAAECGDDTPTYSVVDEDGIVQSGERPLCADTGIVVLDDPGGVYIVEIRSPTFGIADYTFRVDAVAADG